MELSELTNVKNKLKTARELFFPKSLAIDGISTEYLDDACKPNGGWADLRDIDLCLSISEK